MNVNASSLHRFLRNVSKGKKDELYHPETPDAVRETSSSDNIEEVAIIHDVNQ